MYFFFLGDSLKKTWRSDRKNVCDAMAGVKGMEWTMLRMSQSMRARPQALTGGLPISWPLVIKIKLKL